MTSRDTIVILGVFVADMTFRAPRQPRIGETLLAESFVLGPGGKGSNQSVAAGRLGGKVHFLTRLGDDDFADMAEALWREAGVTPAVTRDASDYTGAAHIFVEAGTGDNAVTISPGAGSALGPADVEARAGLIAGAGVVMAQLEHPLEATRRAFQIAREGGARTILNPAPAAELDDAMLALCDIVTPNESETEALIGRPVEGPKAAAAAAAALRRRGCGAVLITLGGEGSYYDDGRRAFHTSAMNAGPVVETTGAGDAFNGGLATGLAEGMEIEEAVRFATAVAALSVTRPGAAASMPQRAEVEALRLSL